MSAALTRVMRVRALQEEALRLELEAEAGRLRDLEERSEAAVLEARNSRKESFASIAGASGDAWQLGDELRLQQEAAWSVAVRAGLRIDERRPGQVARVETARERFLAGRGERMQVETLLGAAAAAALAERNRREQYELDDWFQSRPKRSVRRPEGDRDDA